MDKKNQSLLSPMGSTTAQRDRSRQQPCLKMMSLMQQLEVCHFTQLEKDIISRLLSVYEPVSLHSMIGTGEQFDSVINWAMRNKRMREVAKGPVSLAKSLLSIRSKLGLGHAESFVVSSTYFLHSGGSLTLRTVGIGLNRAFVCAEIKAVDDERLIVTLLSSDHSVEDVLAKGTGLLAEGRYARGRIQFSTDVICHDKEARTLHLRHSEDLFQCDDRKVQRYALDQQVMLCRMENRWKIEEAVESVNLREMSLAGGSYVSSQTWLVGSLLAFVVSGDLGAKTHVQIHARVLRVDESGDSFLVHFEVLNLDEAERRVLVQCLLEKGCV